MRRAPKIDLTDDERFVLAELATNDSKSDQLALRARIVLAASTGKPVRDIAFDLGTFSRTVSRWRTRFVKHRINGIRIERGRGGRKPLSRIKHASEILKATKSVDPPDGRRWSCRGLAAHLGLSPSLVQRVWKSAGVTIESRSDQSTSPPFREGDRVFVLGGFFCGDQRVIVAEVLSSDYENVRDRHVDPVVVISPSFTADCSAIGVARERRMQIDQFICFLTKVQKQATSGSALRIIAESTGNLSHHRLRRWLKRSGRFSIHSSSVIRNYLNDAESDLLAFVSQRFSRAVGARLRTLGEPQRERSNMSLDGAFDLSGVGLSSIATPAAS